MEDSKMATSESPRRRVLFVSAGASHTVALLSGDAVCAWGRGEDGQLGHGDAEERHLPTIISSLGDCEISAITCGADHTTAYSDATRTAYSWGWGDFGRLGHGNSSDLFIPHPVKALRGIEIKQIACGDSHCLAITTDGDVHSWGRNQNGQLGLGHSEDALVPQKVVAFEGIAVKMLAAGAEHTAAVTESGKLYGWGWGRYGNLGLGDRNDRLVPGEVARVNNEKFTLVACGWRHTISVAESGNLYTFGWSKYGQLGHGDYLDHLVPHQVSALKNNPIVQVRILLGALPNFGVRLPMVSYADFFLSRFTAGWLVFGVSAVPVLGICSFFTWFEFTKHCALMPQISGGWRHTVALDSSGRLYGWGWNKFGQVGVGNTDDQTSPQLVKNLSEERVKQVSCGWRHTICITENDNVFSWGRGTSGQLGHGDAVDRNSPKRIEALSADGLACQELESSRTTSAHASHWISPSERYAVVPVETVRSLSRNLHQNANVGESEVPSSDASVPDTDVKRLRTGH